MASNYLRILQELESSGVGEKKDISSLLLQLFPKPTSTQDYDVGVIKGKFLHLLEDMGRNNHITYDQSGLHQFGVREDRNEYWFGLPFNMAITAPGLEYLHSIILAESVLSTNKSATKTNNATVRNSNIQLVFSIATIALAILTAFLTYKYSKTNDELKKRIEPIERKMPQQKQIQYLKKAQRESIEPKKKK